MEHHPETAPASRFHPGELRVQERAGVAAVAARVAAGNLAERLDADFAAFLGERFYLIAAAMAPDGRMWATPLSGPPGFARALDPERILIEAEPLAGDPLAAALAAGPVALGLLAIDQATRGRIRLNGQALATPEGIVVHLREVFGNCPKHIGRRVPVELHAPGATAASGRRGDRLDAAQRALITRADTLFLATGHVQRGADASHRGGRPGFAEVPATGDRLVLPDYAGNRMFQTLGNLELDPRIGVLVVDWESGRTLQLSGRARIIWDGAEVAEHPRAERLVEIDVEAVIDRPQGFPVRMDLIEPSRVNPPVRAQGE